MFFQLIVAGRKNKIPVEIFSQIMLRGGTMPLNEVDANASLRCSFSRSSDISTIIPRPDSNLDSVSKSAGVQSMLKTTTEDDLSSLALKSTRLPKNLHAPSRRQHGIPPSRPSSNYSRTGSKAGSIQSKSSNKSISDQQPPEIWPYGQFPRASSLDVRHSPADDKNRTIRPSSRSVTSTLEAPDADQRSFSLTQPRPPYRVLSNHRSASSLRNRAADSARPCSPYVYPARLRRPGFRPASPALSDTNAGLTIVRPSLAPTTFTGSPRPQSKVAANRYSPLRPMRHEIFPQSSWRTNGHSSTMSSNLNPANNFSLMGTGDGHSIEGTTQPVSMSVSRHERRGPPHHFNPSPLGNAKYHIERTSLTKTNDTVETPHVGFVRRVKQALEDKALMEGASWKLGGDRTSPIPKLETNNTKVETQQPFEAKRLTRDMIKAAVGPPSDSGAISPTPDALDSVQAENSVTEGSSIRAYTSFDIPRAPSTPPLPGGSNPITTSVEDADSSTAQESLDAGKIDIQSTSQYGTDTIDEHTLPNDATVHEVAEPDPTSPELDEDGFSALDAPKTKLDSNNPAKRPASLPQPDLEHSSNPSLDRRSLPAMTVFDQGTFPTFPANQQIDQSSNACPSLSSVQTEETVANEAGTAPSSTHSFFRSSSNSLGETSAFSAFKSYFRSRGRPFSALSELKSDTDLASGEHKIRLAPGLDLPALQIQSSKVSLVRPGKESNETVEPSHNLMNGADRLSAMKQYQFTLPDLAEDSQEDASTTNIRILGSKPPNFRVGALKRVRREKRGSHQPTIMLEPPPSYVSRTLKDTRNMPSLQFSQTDLTTKLNNALSFPWSPSGEDLVPSLMQTPPGERDAVSTLVQQRYKSFFADHDNPVEEENSTTNILPEVQAEQRILLTEIERLSIPSVNGLTLRLSELLPAIKTCNSQLDLTDTGETVESPGEESQRPESGQALTGSGKKRISLMSALSAGSAARSGRSVFNALSPTNLNLAEEVIKYRLMKDLPPLPKEPNDETPLVRPSSNLIDQQQEVNDMPAELEATVPIDTADAQGTKLAELEASNGLQKKSTIAKCSSSGPEYDPGDPGSWIKLNSCSGNEEDLMFEISPLNAGQRILVSNTPRLGTSELTPDTTERIVRSMSPGPHVENFLVPRSDAESELEEVKSNGKGILGSIQRKMGKKPRIDKAGFPVDPIFLHPEERFTEPGDRYPTSGLTPPSNVNMEEARSYFSDDSSENERNNAGLLRKRLTRLRYRHSRNRASTQTRGGSRANSVPESGVTVQNGLQWEDDPEPDSTRSTLSVNHPDFVVVYDHQPVGMSKLEFRAKRFVEKLRILWSKSENLIRSMSRTRKYHPNEWVDENGLYEGA